MFRDQTWLVLLIWLSLVGVTIFALTQGRLPLAFVALATLGLSMAPMFVARWTQVHVPPSFMAAIVIFVGGTVFLGEVFDFYERYWWWDIVMHGGSAIGFGLIGFLLVFMMFQGDKFNAPHIAVAFFGACFAIAIGALWEIFEFSMDQTFGFNMQKSGLMDTMGDLIMDAVGALIGAGAGFAYLKGKAYGGVGSVIDEFIRKNPRFFKRWRK